MSIPAAGRFDVLGRVVPVMLRVDFASIRDIGAGPGLLQARREGEDDG